MSRIKLDVNSIKIISLFETITRAAVKDCFEDNERIVIVVNEGEIGKAIGKGSVNIRKIEGALKKKIKVIEFSPDLQQFIKNVVYPLRLSESVVEGEIATLTAVDHPTRGLLIGRGAQNLRSYETIVKRYFPVKELKVNP